MFDQLEFGPEVKRIATKSLMNMAADVRIECFAAETQASKAFLETTNLITFVDEDMEVEYLEHQRPFYLTSTINGVQIRRALIHTRASFNLISLSTSEAIGKVGKRIPGTPMKIIGFGGDT